MYLENKTRDSHLGSGGFNLRSNVNSVTRVLSIILSGNRIDFYRRHLKEKNLINGISDSINYRSAYSYIELNDKYCIYTLRTHKAFSDYSIKK